MQTNFAQVELIKLQDNFFNETGIEAAQLLSQIEKQELQKDERIQKISAEEY